ADSAAQFCSQSLVPETGPDRPLATGVATTLATPSAALAGGGLSVFQDWSAPTQPPSAGTPTGAPGSTCTKSREPTRSSVDKVPRLLGRDRESGQRIDLYRAIARQQGCRVTAPDRPGTHTRGEHHLRQSCDISRRPSPCTREQVPRTGRRLSGQLIDHHRREVDQRRQLGPRW